MVDDEHTTDTVGALMLVTVCGARPIAVVAQCGTPQHHDIGIGVRSDDENIANLPVIAVGI